MRIVSGIMACAVVSLFLHLMTLQWWWVQLVPLVYSFLAARSWKEGFLVGSIGPGLLWVAASLTAMHGDGVIVAGRVAGLLSAGAPWVLVAITGLIAFVTGGIAGASGALVRITISGTRFHSRPVPAQRDTHLSPSHRPDD